MCWDLTSIISFNPHRNPVGYIFVSPYKRGCLQRLSNLVKVRQVAELGASNAGQADAKACAYGF